MNKLLCFYSKQIGVFICKHPQCHNMPIICQKCKIEQGCRKEHTHGFNQILYITQRWLYFQAENFIKFTKISLQMTDPFYTEANLLEIEKQKNVFHISIDKKHLKIIKDIYESKYQFLTGSLVSKIFFWFLDSRPFQDFKKSIDQKYYNVICLEGQQQNPLKRSNQTELSYIEKQLKCFIEKKRRIQKYQSKKQVESSSKSASIESEKVVQQANQHQTGSKDLSIQEAEQIYKQGVKLMNRSSYYKAQRLFKKCQNVSLQIQNKFFEPYYGLGKLYYYKDEYKKSEAMYKKALSINQHKAQIYLAFGQLYLKTKEDNKFQNIYNQAIKKLNKKSELKIIFYDYISFCTSHFEKCEQIFQILKSANEKKLFTEKQFLAILAEVSYNKGHFKYSSDFYHQILDKATQDQQKQQAYLTLADIFIRLKQYKTALEHLKKIEETYTNKTQIQYLKCIIYKNLNEPEKGLECIEKVLQKTPQISDYIYEKAILLSELKRYTQAQQLLVNLAKIGYIKEIQLIEINYKLGKIFQMKEIIQKYFHSEIQSNYQSSLIFHSLANINYQEKELCSAILSYTQAISYFEDAEYYASRAQCSIELNRLQDAIEDYLIASEIKDSYQFSFQLCELYLMKYNQNHLNLNDLRYSLKHINKVINQSKYVCDQTKQKYLIKKGDILLELALASNGNNQIIAEALQCFLNAVSIPFQNKLLKSRILRIKQQLKTQHFFTNFHSHIRSQQSQLIIT